MTEEEKITHRLIAETTKVVVDQQQRVARLIEENQPVEAAVEFLCALLDTLQKRRLKILRGA
ncbi:MAG TPA: hypothetical protein VFO36_03270 [Nitrospiraceae bacterium]|nr:hypothetical protein [Nitrospiraceae bacterium]